MVPSTLSPSQPLSRRKRASATERAQSGSPVASIAVAIAAITPRRELSIIERQSWPHYTPGQRIVPQIAPQPGSSHMLPVCAKFSLQLRRAAAGRA